ncbi:MAG: winged helix-turn-helix transcriptional regulator [Clostridia bacterium]|nr:winged helix-turn-helix transcriptional regulator [Clostridia bacterium]
MLYSFNPVYSIALNPAEFRVSLWGKEHRLTQQEYLLFEKLLQSALSACKQGMPVRAVSRGELLCTAWGSAAAYATRTVDVHIQRLRAKMGNDLITTVYRQGYCINPVALSRLAPAV